MHLHARTVMHSAPRACWRAGRLSHAWPSNASVRRCSQQAYVAKSPCIVVTAVDGIHNQALQELADQVSQQLQLDTLVIAPAPSHDNHSSSSSSSKSSAGHHHMPDALTFDQQLDLQQHQDLGQYTFSLQGATPADCVLCAVDQTCGLAKSLSLAPVMVLVGVARAPALSSDMDTHPAVAVARQAALLGLPALAVCLATTSAAAPLSPAVAATVQLLEPLVQLLQSNRSWPSPSNFPRAHFPFPEQGRWALGTQMPLPNNPAARAGGSHSSSWEGYVSAATDCWALGEDNSWLGDYTSSRSRRGRPATQNGNQRSDAAERSRQLLRSAWADGDALLCLNVPPTWKPSAGFAATRPGVLWHCWQVAAQGQLSQQLQAAASAGGYSSSNSSSSTSWRSGSDDSSSRWTSGHEDSSSRWRSSSEDSSSSSSSRSWRSSSSSSPSWQEADRAGGDPWQNKERGSCRSDSSSGTADKAPSWRTSQHGSQDSSSSRSWRVDGQDLYGRTLPSTSYSSSGSTAAPAGSNFVGQDNTAKVASDISSRWGNSNSSSGGSSRPTPGQPVLPSSFKVQRGTLLNDAAACGDVEAVFGGKAAVTLCQTWPAGHPLSLRDELLLAALDEGQGGLPAWLCGQ